MQLVGGEATLVGQLLSAHSHASNLTESTGWALPIATGIAALTLVFALSLRSRKVGLAAGSKSVTPPASGYYFRFGWMLFYPLLMLGTLLLKFKNRHLGTDERYLEHQRAFFGFFRRLSPNLADLMARTDKFHAVRPIIASHALAELKSEPILALDVATGHGFQAAALKDAGARAVHGIDIVPARIEGARQMNGEAEILFSVMDATNLAYANDSFDCATISAALHDMPAQTCRRALAEIVRVTKHNVVILEPRVVRGRIRGLLGGLVAELLDESLNIGQFVRGDLDDQLQQLGLEVLSRTNVYRGVLTIWHCRSHPSAEDRIKVGGARSSRV